MTRLLSVLTLLLVSLTAGGWLAPQPGQAQNLWVWQQRIDWQFKVDQLAPEDFARMQAEDKDNLLVFDVREEAEYAVSHLEGARRVDPNIDPQAFVQRFGDQVRGKHLIFYCSIGWRSSELADVLAPQLAGQGASAISNLRGGIFRWHNESRPLVNVSGSTDKLHPYGPDWAGLVQRQWLTAYQP